MIDEGTTMATLRALLDEFAHAMFGAGTRTRFRPGYYPFTEPSVAFDIGCLICGGVGCPACKRTGWLTILGAGMVHPVVLRNGGIDPEVHQGFAFGMGIDRIAMLRHGIPDIRAFLANDLRFLERFNESDGRQPAAAGCRALSRAAGPTGPRRRGIDESAAVVAARLRRLRPTA